MKHNPISYLFKYLGLFFIFSCFFTYVYFIDGSCYFHILYDNIYLLYILLLAINICHESYWNHTIQPTTRHYPIQQHPHKNRQNNTTIQNDKKHRYRYTDINKTKMQATNINPIENRHIKISLTRIENKQIYLR